MNYLQAILGMESTINESRRFHERHAFEEPGMFWYYNNGITIVTSSDDIELESAGKVILARQWNDNGLNFSVINGAQTISTASRIFYGSGNNKDKVKKQRMRLRYY